MNTKRPIIEINGKIWIDCPEPLSYLAADHANKQGHDKGSREWWEAFRAFKREYREKKNAEERINEARNCIKNYETELKVCSDDAERTGWNQ